MRKRFHYRRHVDSIRGGVIISVLFFILIISILLLGVGTFAASNQQRATVDVQYAQAMDVAEAGINYEFRKISNDFSSADQQTAKLTTSFGHGTFTVWCTATDGSNWTPGTNNLVVWGTGIVSGVTRTIKVAAKGFTPIGKYAIYTMHSTSVWNGSAISISGDVGTNGSFNFNGHPGITGSVYFDGSSAGWYNGIDPGGYSVVHEPHPLTWTTVDQKALELYPNSGATAPGGMTYLATHNNNATASPPISGNSITDSVTLVGPGDYYVTNIDLKGNNHINLNNTNGPVRLWIGPSGGSGTCNFRGGTAAISASSDPTKACFIYCATSTGINIAGNEQLDAAIYAYNIDNSGNPYGYVVNSGNPVINGQILANEVDINGNITVNYVPGLIKPTSIGYYGFDNSWVEINLPNFR